MARTYAVVLGLVGIVVVLARALKNGAGLETTIAQALLWAGIMSAIGIVVGAIAAATVDESVRSQTQSEIDAFRTASDEQQALSNQ